MSELLADGSEVASREACRPDMRSEGRNSSIRPYNYSHKFRCDVLVSICWGGPPVAWEPGSFNIAMQMYKSNGILKGLDVGKFVHHEGRATF